MYFEKHRAIAYGVATVGASAASMTFPWVTSQLIEEYAWTGALMVSAGLIAQMCVGAMVLRPVPKYKQQEKMNLDKEKNKDDFVTQTKILFRNGNFILHSISAALLHLSASVAYTHLVAFAKSEDISSDWSNTILTAIGGATIGMYYHLSLGFSLSIQ